MPRHIVILGAGISGLACAWSLKKRWGSQIQLTLIEKSDRVGGWIRTIEKDGFLFDLGPRSCRSYGSGLASLQLIEDLQLQDQVIVNHPSAQHRYLYWQQQLQLIPNKLLSGLFSPLMRGVRKAFYRDLVASRKVGEQDESIYDFFARRFNVDFAERFIDPLISGIYAGDMRSLSVQACFPFLREAEQSHRSVLMGMMLRRKPSRPSTTPFIQSIQASSLFSFKHGMETLPRTLAAKLEADIQLNSEPQNLSFDSDYVKVQLKNGKYLEADIVISALPAPILSKLMEPHLSDDFIHPLECMPYSTVAVVNLGYKSPVLKKQGFGYLIPRQEGEEILGCVWDSSVFPQQNQGEETRLTVMLGGIHNLQMEHLSQEDYLYKALKALDKHLQLSSNPDCFHVSLAHRAIPQYLVGHQLMVQSFSQAIRSLSPRLSIIGNAFHGVSVNDCIQNSSESVLKMKSA